MRRLSLYFLLVWFISSPSLATFDAIGTLRICGKGIVAEALSGDLLKLSNGTTVALADVKAPEYWPGGTPYKSWPYGFTVKESLGKIAEAQHVTLYCSKKHTNSFGEKIAYVQLENGTWLQSWLLENGYGFFYPTTANAALSRQLYMVENKARNRKAGLWALEAYTTVAASGTNLKPGWFQIVTGTILSATKVRDVIFFNFGENWRKDFTIQLNRKIEKSLKKQNIDPLSLTRAHIEVRGWVEWSGGPKIILTHPDQLQILTLSESR